jgi:hypothetical protein
MLLRSVYTQPQRPMGQSSLFNRECPMGNESQSWSGQYKGKKRPTCVYVYVIVIEYGNGTSGILDEIFTQRMVAGMRY